MRILITICVIASSCAVPEPSPSAISSRVAQIDGMLASMRSDTITVFDYSTEGAEIEGHFAGTSLRRLRVVYFGEAGRASETFYFDPELVFTERIEVRYDAPLTGRTADSSAQRRFLSRDTIWGRNREVLATDARAKAILDSLSTSANALRARLIRP